MNGIAGFVRVSSRAQNAKTQRATISTAATARGETIGQWFAETMTGRTMKRPKLDELRAAVRTGIVRRIYTFKIDRFTRSGVGDTFALLREFNNAGCEVIAVVDNLHLRPGSEDVQTEVFLFALGLAAKLERLAIAERISAARDRVEAEGGHWGRPRRMDHATIQKARALKRDGMTIRQIAARLKTPRATVARTLSRKPARPPHARRDENSKAEPAKQVRSQKAATETRKS